MKVGVTGGGVTVALICARRVRVSPARIAHRWFGTFCTTPLLPRIFRLISSSLPLRRPHHLRLRSAPLPSLPAPVLRAAPPRYGTVLRHYALLPHAQNDIRTAVILTGGEDNRGHAWRGRDGVAVIIDIILVRMAAGAVRFGSAGIRSTCADVNEHRRRGQKMKANQA